MEPRIQYVTTPDGVSIAYWLLGEGTPVVHMSGAPFNHVQLEWQQQSYTTWNELLADRWKTVKFDARGSGLSDRDVADLSLDARVADIDAVTRHVGFDKFAFVAIEESGIPAIAYTSRYPERVSHLVLWDSYPSGARFLKIPQVHAFEVMMESDWEMFTQTLASVMFGWSAGEPARSYAAFLRECVTSEQAQAVFNSTRNWEVTSLLPEIKQPTLIIQHRRVVFPDLETARFLASRIPNAELLILEGTWNESGQDTRIVAKALERLLDGKERPTKTVVEPEPVAARSTEGSLATILFTDVEGSTALTDHLGDAAARKVMREHERITRQQLAIHGGSEVKTMGDGFMASFRSATRALECAIAIQRAFAEQTSSLPARPEVSKERAEDDAPIRVRIGLNAGEPIAEDDDLFGTAVIVASRIAAMAEGGEILVSDVVRQLVAGKDSYSTTVASTRLKGSRTPCACSR